MIALAATDAIGSPAAVLVMIAASIVVVADNGLAFTAIAEYAGPAWSGRGLAVQNTGQYVVSAAVVPLVAGAIEDWGYAWAYALCALPPIVALALAGPTPFRQSHLDRGCTAEIEGDQRDSRSAARPPGDIAPGTVRVTQASYHT